MTTIIRSECKLNNFTKCTVSYVCIFVFLMLLTYSIFTDNPNVIYSYQPLPETMEGNSSQTQTVERKSEFYDIMSTPQIQFNKSYKNPCWIGTKDNGPINDGMLHCLPYFYLLGVKKSGTTDLYSRIAKHPQFARPADKESQWLPRLRFGTGPSRYKGMLRRSKIEPDSVGFYVTMFNKPTFFIKSSVNVKTDDDVLTRKITGDGTPANFHMHSNWSKLPGNIGLTEPKYTNFHYLKHITPDAKIIIIFRDPVSRMFSDYLFKNTRARRQRGLVPERFHREAVLLTESYKKCFEKYSQRRCIYNETLKKTLSKRDVKLAVSFTAGFYAFYLNEVYEVFDKGNVMPILMTDYIVNMKETLSKVFDFLGLDKPSKGLWKAMLVKRVINKSSLKKLKMLDETKILLQEFYKPFNEEMALLVNDSRYRFL